MRKAVDRLWEVVFTPSIRWYRMPKPDIKYPRYPSPASEPINHEMNHSGYKAAYRDSTHSVRYSSNLHEEQETECFHYIAEAIGDTPADKLVKFGYITPEQRGDALAIESAKIQYEKDLGYPLTSGQTVFEDELGYGERNITKQEPESVAHFVRQYITASKEVNAQESWLSDMEDIYNPTIYHFKSYDMLDEPVFRQLKLDLEWQIDLWTDKREQAGYMPVFKGDPQFWNALDNSFSSENIKKVQEACGQDVEQIDTSSLIVRNNATTDYPGMGRHRQEFPIRSDFR